MSKKRSELDSRAQLPRSFEIIEAGIAEGLHTGAQLYVSCASETVADVGLGEARPGVAMTPDTILRWMSAVKPVMAVTVAQLWEAGRLELDDPVAQHIREFAANGKERITIRHLLTHTAGLPDIEYRRFPESAEQVVGWICEGGLRDGWVPGKKAGYDPGASWFILAEIVRRVTGQSYHEYAHEHIFQPLGMADSWTGMSKQTHRAYGDRVALIYDTSGQQPKPLTWQTADLQVPWPGGSGRGPVRELGRFYEMLEARGRGVVSAQSVEALTSRHRVRMHDHTFGFVYDWGLGLMLDSKGNQNVSQLAYDFGAHASRRTFGHGGSQCATGFCDPERRLVVAWAFNGLPGEAKHRNRNHALNTAIYEDLGLE